MNKRKNEKLDTMPVVSIIIIAYNTGKWIREAIESAIKQTLKNIEIVILDDCSTDETYKIIRNYAKRDKRIKALRNNKNEGTFISRCRAFAQTTGEYIMFLDSDDFLDINACKYLVKEMKSGDWDLFGFNTKTENEYELEEERLRCLQNYLEMLNTSMSGKQGILIPYFIESKLPWNVWNKIYKRKLLEKVFILFSNERIQIAEDLLISSLIFCYAKSFSSTLQYLYHYRIGSGMTTGYSSSLSEKTVIDIARLGKVYFYLSETLTNTEIDKETCAKLLNFVKIHTISEVMYEWTHSIPAHLYTVFLSTMLEYLDLKKWAKEYVQWAFENQSFDFVRAGWVFAKSLPPVSKKKIKTVAMYYHRLYNGGVERVMSLLTPILQGVGYKVIIITDEGPTVDDYLLPENVQHVRIVTSGNSPVKRLEEWQKIIKIFSIDEIIYHAWMSVHMSLDSIAIKSMQIPLICHAHNSFQYIFKTPSYSGINWLEQDKIYSPFDLITVLSEVDMYWCNSFGLPATLVNNPLLYNPADCVSTTYKTKEAIWVGRLNYEKQFDDAFEIARLVKRKIPSFKLHVLGRAETETENKRIKENLVAKKLDDCVILEGFFQDISSFYQNSSLLLVTSAFEGFHMASQEAKCFGLPIVSYDLPNLTLFRQPDSGVSIVPQRDMVAAANRIIELLNNPELLEKEGKKAKSSIENLYKDDLGQTWKTILEIKCFQKKNIKGKCNDALNVAIRLATENTIEYVKNNQTLSSYSCDSVKIPNQTEFYTSFLDSFPPTNPIYMKNKSMKQIVGKIIKFCMPNWIIQIHVLRLEHTSKGSDWEIKQIINAALPYGVVRVIKILKAKVHSNK